MAKRSPITKVALVLLLGLALAGVLLIQFGGRKATPRVRGGAVAPLPQGRTSSLAGTGKAPSETIPKAQVQWKKPAPVGPVLRNPMHLELPKPPPPPPPAVDPNVAVVHPKEPEFMVTGIIYSTEQPSSVIIEGRILHEGDTVYGATIARIAPNSVEFSLGDQKWTVEAGEKTTSPP